MPARTRRARDTGKITLALSTGSGFSAFRFLGSNICYMKKAYCRGYRVYYCT